MSAQGLKPYFMRFVFLLGLCLYGTSYAQSEKDSLLEVWKSKNEIDSIRLKTLVKVIWDYYLYADADSAYVLASSGYDFARRKNLKKEQARFLDYMGKAAEMLGRSNESLNCFEKANKIYHTLNDDEGVAITLNSMAIVYTKQGIYTKSIEYFSESLKIYRKLGNQEGIISANNNLGIMHVHLNNMDDAANTFKECLRLATEIGDKKIMANALNNLGNVYTRKRDVDSAVYFFNTCLPLRVELKDKYGEASTYANLANIYSNNTQYDLAEEYFKKSLDLRAEISDLQGINSSKIGLASILSYKGLYRKSNEIIEPMIEEALQQNNVHNLRELHRLLYTNYREMGLASKALTSYEFYVKIKDSLNNDENNKNLFKEQFKLDYEKKVYADSIRELEEKKVIQARFEQERTQRMALYGGLSVVLVFAGFMYNRFRVTRKQKRIIEHQKKEVETVHKEITDSINYAERIQRSFLATREILDEHLGDYFVFFKPKDVVSGDFYWAGVLNNGKFAFSVADSTGHGVPGAIMSILNISSLEKAIETETEPHDILAKTRKIIVQRLKKDGSLEGGKDGMDCSLLVINKERTELTFAAAHNPVFIVREVTSGSDEGGVSRSETQELIEYKGDKMPVGKHDRDQEPFTLQTVQLQKGDVIYTLTDGFSDQFGGGKGKKFMHKQLKNLLLEISDKSMREQQEVLSDVFSAWKGDLEQVDDICIIGVRI